MTYYGHWIIKIVYNWASVCLMIDTFNKERRLVYTIGEIAKIIGISRDKLRYYEEKGIIAPSQDDSNQYRQYDYEDILGILSIDFYRSLDIDFKTIKRIHSAGSIDGLKAIITSKKAAVTDEIERLSQIAHRMDALIAGCDDIESQCNRFSIRQLGPFEVLGEVSDFAAFEEFDAIHQVRSRLGGAAIIKSMVRQLTYDDNGPTSSKMLIVNEQATPGPDGGKLIQYDKCLYTVIEDRLESALAIQEVFHQIKQWLFQNGLQDKNIAFLRMILIAPKAAHSESYLELFVPVV